MSANRKHNKPPKSNLLFKALRQIDVQFIMRMGNLADDVKGD